MKRPMKFKGMCGKLWIQTCSRNGHINAECEHHDGMHMTTERIGAEEEALKICKKCPYSTAT